MENRDNLNLIHESELGNTNAGFDNPPPYQPPYPSPVEGECFTPQPGKTPQQDGDYPQHGGFPQQPGGYPPQPGGYPQPGGHPQHPGDYPPQPGGYPQHGGYPQPPGGYPPQPGGYPPQPGGYGQPGYDQQGYPQGQYVQQQQQTVIVTQPMEQSVVKGQSRPRNYLIPAIFACLLCCCPIGLCAIHYATKANALADEGSMTEARIAAKTALCMTITSVIVGLILMSAYMLFSNFSKP